jgi:hypothetical protein
MPSLYHLTALSVGARPIFADPAAQLAAIRRFVAQLGPRILWFAWPDTHAHFIIAATPAEIGRIRRDFDALARSLGPDALQPCHAKPIVEQGHLENCWSYVVANRERHGLPGDPLADPGTGLVDVIRARRLPGFSASTWKAHLPRRTLRWLLERLGASERVLVPATDAAIRDLGAAALARAGAAAVGWPLLEGKNPEVVAARAAVFRVGSSAGIARSELVHALGIRRETSYRLEKRPDDGLDEVLRRRVSYELVIAQHTGPRRPARE